jgi:hypothetical protein
VTEGEALPPALTLDAGGATGRLKAMYAAGTLVVAGTDTMIAPNLHAEIASYVDGGFTPFQALQTATVNSAKALNLDAGTLGGQAGGYRSGRRRSAQGYRGHIPGETGHHQWPPLHRRGIAGQGAAQALIRLQIG